MWKQIFEWSRGIIFLTRDVAELQAEMNQVRDELRELQLGLNGLVHKFELLSERERLEREKLALALDNALLRIERRIPTSSKKGK